MIPVATIHKSFEELLEERKVFYDERVASVPSTSLEELIKDLYKTRGIPFSITTYNENINRDQTMCILPCARTLPRHTWRTQRMRAMRICSTK